VHLSVRGKQFYYADCCCYFTQQIPFADSNKSHTHRQEKWIFELSRKQPLNEVGALLNINTKTVERIFYASTLPDRDERYEGVTHSGVDEISWRKGKKDYICCLTNLKIGDTIAILRSHNKEALNCSFSID
jgi:transposase